MAAAARALSYSHSAISQQLSLLESETGVAVVERVGRGVRLTPAGLALVRSTERILAEMERAEAELADVDQRLHGQVTVGAFATVSRVVIPPVVAKLSNEHPDLDIRLRQLAPEEALLALASRSIDLAVIDAYPGLPAPRVGELTTTKIAIDPIRAYLPAGVDPATDPAALRWGMEPTGTAAADWTLHQCRSLGFEPNVVSESGDLLSTLRMVEHGLIAAFLPDLLVRDAGATLTPAPGMPGDLHRSIHVVVRAGAEKNAALVAVHEALRVAMTPAQG